MPRAGFLSVTGEWDNLAVTVEANAAELAYLAETRTQLLVTLDAARAASVRQATLQAQYQQATRDLEKLLSEGGDLATRIRSGLRMQYGFKAEKLTEFGMKPRRKRSRPRKEEPVPAPTPTPAPNSASNRP
ncbi:MAG TPA: hypothetical protein VLT87_01770 [Thermoanaerobaculia bacterium]|nr:hypothetical protein [Thermoanaerobaculia bacterium]